MTTGLPQHMGALKRANEVRLARAAMKRDVAAGNVKVSEIIHDMPWCMESITLSELLCSQRRWGRTRARKFLSELTLKEGKQLQDTTIRQRQMLAAELRERNL